MGSPGELRWTMIESMNGCDYPDPSNGSIVSDKQDSNDPNLLRKTLLILAVLPDGNENRRGLRLLGEHCATVQPEGNEKYRDMSLLDEHYATVQP